MQYERPGPGLWTAGIVFASTAAQIVPFAVPANFQKDPRLSNILRQCNMLKNKEEVRNRLILKRNRNRDDSDYESEGRRFESYWAYQG